MPGQTDPQTYLQMMELARQLRGVGELGRTWYQRLVWQPLMNIGDVGAMMLGRKPLTYTETGIPELEQVGEAVMNVGQAGGALRTFGGGLSPNVLGALGTGRWQKVIPAIKTIRKLKPKLSDDDLVKYAKKHLDITPYETETALELLRLNE